MTPANEADPMAVAREALEPFVNVARPMLHGYVEDDEALAWASPLGGNLMLSDFRRAAKALAALSALPTPTATAALAPFAREWRSFTNHPQLPETNAQDGGLGGGLIFADYERAAEAYGGEVRERMAPRPYPRATGTGKISEVLSFEGGDLTLKTEGFGKKNGDGYFVFDEDDLQLEQADDSNKVYRILDMPNSELGALRDKLNEWFPAPSPPSAEARDMVADMISTGVANDLSSDRIAGAILAALAVRAERLQPATPSVPPSAEGWEPVLWSLQNVDSGFVLASKTYRREEAATAAARERSDNYCSYRAAPLFVAPQPATGAGGEMERLRALATAFLTAYDAVEKHDTEAGPWDVGTSSALVEAEHNACAALRAALTQAPGLGAVEEGKA